MKTSVYATDLADWQVDGQGQITSTGPDAWEVSVVTPLTLWLPHELPEHVEIAFECNVRVANSAMLLIAAARNWRGKPLLETTRSGAYKDYAYDDMACYTIGFNRASHVSHEVQPNASRVNIRRIGGQTGVAFADVDLNDQSQAMRDRWTQWDQATLLCSTMESASGIGFWQAYRVILHGPDLQFYQGDQLLVRVVDHHPDALCGGCLALRNMTPGGAFGLRHLRINPLVPQSPAYP